MERFLSLCLLDISYLFRGFLVLFVRVTLHLIVWILRGCHMSLLQLYIKNYRDLTIIKIPPAILLRAAGVIESLALSKLLEWINLILEKSIDQKERKHKIFTWKTLLIKSHGW